MQNPISDVASADKIADLTQTAQDQACGLLKTGTDFVKENPLPVVFGALLVGVALGSLVGRREEEELDRLQSARRWIEDAYSNLADRIPQPKKSFFSCAQPGLFEQAQDFGKKLKWW